MGRLYEAIGYGVSVMGTSLTRRTELLWYQSIIDGFAQGAEAVLVFGVDAVGEQDNRTAELRQRGDAGAGIARMAATEGLCARRSGDGIGPKSRIAALGAHILRQTHKPNSPLGYIFGRSEKSGIARDAAHHDSSYRIVDATAQAERVDALGRRDAREQGVGREPAHRSEA